MRQRITPLKQRLRLYAGRLRLERHRHSVWVKLQRVKHGARDSLRSIVNHSVSTVPFESTLYFTSCTFARVFVSTNLFVVNLQDIIVGILGRFASLCAPFLPSSLVPRARATVRVHPPVVLRRSSFPFSSAPSSSRSPSSSSMSPFDSTMPRHTSVTPSASSPYLTHEHSLSSVCPRLSLSVRGGDCTDGRTDGRTYTVRRRRRRVLSLLLVPTGETEDRLDSQ